MFNFFKNKKIIFLSLLILFSIFYFLFSISSVLAQIPFTPQIPIPGMPEIKEVGDWTLVDYISSFYRWSVTAIAIIAVVVIMISGIQWILAAGNPPAIQKAREQMMSAIIGLILVLLAIPILRMINPVLVRLSMFEIPEITPIEIERPPGFTLIVKVDGGRGSNQNIFAQGGNEEGSLIIELWPTAGTKIDEIKRKLRFIDLDDKTTKIEWIKIIPPLPNQPWISDVEKKSFNENAACASIGEGQATGVTLRCIKISTKKFIKTKNDNDPFYSLGEYKVVVSINGLLTMAGGETSVKVVRPEELPPECACEITQGQYVACETCIKDSQNNNTGELCMSTSQTTGMIIKNCEICPLPSDQCSFPQHICMQIGFTEYRPSKINHPIYNNKRFKCTNPPRTPDGCIAKYECINVYN